MGFGTGAMGSVLWPVALAALLAAPLVTSEDAGEASPTDQRYIPERHPGVPLAGDKCDCLNWKDLFTLGRVWCGEGNEYYRIKNKSGMSKLDLLLLTADPASVLHEPHQAMCTDLLNHFDMNNCINIGTGFAYDPQDWRTGQWCYVPFSCRELHGGGRLQSKPVSWKICSSERGDTLFRNWHPEQLFHFAQHWHPHKTILQSLLWQSYSYLRPEIWWDIKKKWRRREFKRLPLMLREAMLADVPIVIETAPPRLAHKQPKRVYYNGTLWHIECVESRPSCVVKEEEYHWPERFD